MQGMSLLSSLSLDYETSDKWYQKLANFAAVRKTDDLAAKEARSRLAYLDIALPQRGNGRPCADDKRCISPDDRPKD